jgi:ribosomal protein L20
VGDVHPQTQHEEQVIKAGQGMYGARQECIHVTRVPRMCSRDYRQKQRQDGGNQRS